MTFNGFCEGLYPNNQGGDTLFSLVRKLNELLPEMIAGIEEGGDSDINNLKLYYDTPSQSLQLQGVEGKVISEISAAPFIKDGMLNAVENDETEHIITLTFNTDAGKQPITLNYDSLWEGMETSLKGYTDSQVSALSSQVVKGIRLGSSTSNEPISDGVVTLPIASGSKDGVMSSEMYKNLNIGFVATIGVQRYSDNLKLNYITRTGIEGALGSYSVTLGAATPEGSGVMSSTDKTKLDSIISTGDGTKFLADDFTYKTIQMPDLSTYATKSELSGYLPLSGGTMTGPLATSQITNLYSMVFSPDVNPNGGVSIMASNGILMLNSSTTNGSGTVLFASNKVQTAVVPEVISGSEFLPLYYSGNFQAGVDYVAPSALDNYLPLSGGSMTGTLHMGTNAISGSKYNIIQAESNGTVNIGATPVKIALCSDRVLQRKTNSSIYTIYDSGNFIAGTNYLAPGGVSIADVSGLQDSLDGKVGLTGDSFKNNNACWGGKKTDGSNVCLALVDPNNNVKIGNPGCGLYLRSSVSIQREVFTSETESDFYAVLDTYNFKAGTNYVAPSTLNNYLPLSGGAMSGNITMNGTNSNIYLRNSATITGYFGEDALPILYADATNNKTVLGTVGKPLQVRSNSPIIRTNSSGTNYTVYDSGNLDVSSFVTTSGNENLVFPQRAITVGELDADEYNYYRVARNNSYSYFTNNSTATVISYETYGSGGSVDATSKLEITTSDLTFNDNHVLTEADTFNTITYTTSASEDNLRAWNNYVNGYVTNLQATDSAVFDLTRQSSGVDKVNRKFEIIIMGGSPRKLILITYTLAEDGSLTKIQEDYTLTPATT